MTPNWRHLVEHQPLRAYHRCAVTALTGSFNAKRGARRLNVSP